MRFGEGIKLFAKVALLTGGICFTLNTVKAEGTIINEAQKQRNYQKVSEYAFEESVDAYDLYVKGIASIMKEFVNTDDIMHVFAAYLEMDESKDLTFGSQSADKNMIDMPGYWGMNVITGDAVCRHHSDNLARVLRELGFNAGVVLGEMFEGEPNNDPNHAVVFVEYDGDVLLLDPVNDTIFLYGSKYYESLDSTYSFVPSLSCDQIYGFANDNFGAYFNHEDISDKKFKYSKALSEAKEEVAKEAYNLHVQERVVLEDYQKIIFKELVYYQTLYGVIENKLGEGATQNDVLDGMLKNYETMDMIHEEYSELLESGYCPK